jgi:hypothetical protein
MRISYQPAILRNFIAELFRLHFMLPLASLIVDFALADFVGLDSRALMLSYFRMPFPRPPAEISAAPSGVPIFPCPGLLTIDD